MTIPHTNDIKAAEQRRQKRDAALRRTRQDAAEVDERATKPTDHDLEQWRMNHER